MQRRTPSLDLSRLTADSDGTMLCPYCAQNKDKVIDSRAAEGGAAIRRRRECLACGKRFTTYEHIETATKLTVVKKDGTRVPYDRRKLLAGVQAACYKRPISAEQVTGLVEEVEEDLFNRGEREVASFDIGELLMDRLKTLDQVAYVRFASVYKSFRDIEDLMAEVREVIESRDSGEARDQGKLF